MSRRRPGKAWWAIGLGVVLALVVAVWVGGDPAEYTGAGDPRNPGPEGGQALAKVLEQEGVDVRIVRSASALEETRIDADTTVVVTDTIALSESTTDRLVEHAAPGRLVLVEPSFRIVTDLDPDLAAGTEDPGAVTARCASGVGQTLDGLSIEVDHLTSYLGGTQHIGCLETERGAVLLEDPERNLVLFGAGEALSNDQVLRSDNAAVALRLLGAHENLVWYVPDPTDATADDAVSLGSLIPDWIAPGLWLGALTMIGVVLWRVRRLGPLATEPLPVVVRAVETARSRGRMYRKSGDRDHAARALRRAARQDIATQLRLDRTVTPDEVVEATARHLDAREDALAPLLTDHHLPPASDADLIALAQQLAHLRREVRR